MVNLGKGDLESWGVRPLGISIFMDTMIEGMFINSGLSESPPSWYEEY